MKSEHAIDVTAATCGTCPFFEYHDTKGQEGDCRRDPPATIQREDGELRTHFPQMVDSLDWCGEHPERKADAMILLARAFPARYSGLTKGY